MAEKKPIPRITRENLKPPYEDGKDYDYFRDAASHPFRHDSSRFELVNAWWLAEISTLVYDAPHAVEGLLRGRAGFDRVEFFDRGPTQCFVMSNDRFAVVAFRGSESSRRQDDPDFRHVLADWMADFRVKLVSSGQGGRVHRGFKAALDEVWQFNRDGSPGGVERHLTELARERPGRTVWFTGHSLGAALATLAADRYGAVRGLYTYGSPRVGDDDFVSDFHVNNYRFVNHRDVVTNVPPSPFYRHLRDSPKYIDRDGAIHDNFSRWDQAKEFARLELLPLFNNIGLLRSGFADHVPDGLLDHVPTLYATHIWNNYVEDLNRLGL